MTYAITKRCDQCETCMPLCPVDAIKLINDEFWIDPNICNNCEGYSETPICADICPVNSPVLMQAKKGRYKAEVRPATSPDLFVGRQEHPFASAIVIWELCNVLAQRQSLPWQEDQDGVVTYQRSVNQNRGSLAFKVAQYPSPPGEAGPIVGKKAYDRIEALDMRAACLHLIYAAYAVTLETPWQEEFTISDRQIETYLGLDKRKDLSKIAKLGLIKDLVEQSCSMIADISWPQQGRIRAFTLQNSAIWHLGEIEHHFQEDDQSCKHLVGLTFRVKPGDWSQYFLNHKNCKKSTAYYQYSSLPQSLLCAVMSLWQQHEGAVRIMLWLLFKVKVGKEQRITVPTFMRIAYGPEKVEQATVDRDSRKRLLRTFESDLEALNHYGLKPIFDPVTYPTEIQPLWAKLADLPDDAEDALEFWTNDGALDTRLTDSPRGKWNRLIHARFSNFELPSDWEQLTLKRKRKRSSQKRQRKSQPVMNGQLIVEARQKSGLSQRELAQKAGKSQSWIRDLENGRFNAKVKDQNLLRKLLAID